MFDFLCCHCAIVRCSRIGRQINSLSRPIKVELMSPGDVNHILSVTRRLRENEFYYGVNISKWLSREELERMKRLRKQCADLNSASKATGKSRPPFVVISGRLMEWSGGKLRLYVATSKPEQQCPQKTTPPSTQQKPVITTSQPKNAA